MNSIHLRSDLNEISIENDGKGIPVQIHKEHKVHVPTMIFGQLLTSSNYDDSEKKVTGGRNGYGAKLTNIYSNKFTVETSDGKKTFKQTWTDNMGKAGEPKIKDATGKQFTRITFRPDLKRFKMEKLDSDILSLFYRRAYDVAGTSGGGVKVTLNGTVLPVKDFKSYVNKYISGRKDENGEPLKLIYEKVSDRWEVACSTSDTGFQQVSFVNRIATTKGGKHVDHVLEPLVKAVVENVKKKNKDKMEVKNQMVRDY